MTTSSCPTVSTSSSSATSCASGDTLPRRVTTRWTSTLPSPPPLLLLLALALTLGSSLGGGGGVRLVEARTFPTEVTKLLALKAELEARGLGYLLDTWKCPPEGEGECDPCGYGAIP